MNSQPLIAERLNNYRHDDLYAAAADVREHRASIQTASAGRLGSRLAALLHLRSPFKSPVQAPAASGRAAGS